MVIYINTGFSSVLEGGETAISQFFLKTKRMPSVDMKEVLMISMNQHQLFKYSCTATGLYFYNNSG